MSHNAHAGPSPDSGLAPAYRFAPDIPAEVAADLARLCASAASAPEPSDAKDSNSENTAPASASPASPASGLAPKGGLADRGRRLALFGAAVALVAPMVDRPAAARVPDADAELARLADGIDRTLDGAAYALEPVDDEDDQNRRLRHAERLMLRMVDVPAAGLAGVNAKAKGYLDSLSYDVLESAALAQSLAEDAERVCAEVLA